MTDKISEQERARELRIAYMNRVDELAWAGHVVSVDPELAWEMGAYDEGTICDQDELDDFDEHYRLHDVEPCHVIFPGRLSSRRWSQSH